MSEFEDDRCQTGSNNISVWLAAVAILYFQLQVSFYGVGVYVEKTGGQNFVCGMSASRDIGTSSLWVAVLNFRLRLMLSALVSLKLLAPKMVGWPLEFCSRNKDVF